MTEFTHTALGTALLSIVSRAQALIAELLRLSDHLPPALNPAVDTRYAPLLFDFKYLRCPEHHEEQIEASPELVSLDDEFRETFSPLLRRFFLVFYGVVKYYEDLLHYLEDLQEGAYIQSSIETVLENEDGRQLLVEALFLHGVLLLLAEHRLKGDLRERLLVAHIRIQGTSDIPNFDSLCTLCRSSAPSATTFTSVATFAAFLQPSPPPVPSTMLMVDKPEDLFARFPLPKAAITGILGRIQSEDLYNQVRHYPSPEHRGTALSAQAACLYVLLYHLPQVLHNDGNTMREIVDRFFKDCWVIPIYMGFTVDLSVAWDRFKAAKSSISSTISVLNVRDAVRRQASKVKNLLAELSGYLSEGALTQDYVLNNVQILLACTRNCNVTIRWLLLHRITASRKLRDLVMTVGDSHAVNEEVLLSLFLDTSRLELELKQVYGNLLEGKEMRWQKCRTQAAECMQELSDFFSGSQVLSRKLKDENLQGWFSQMSAQVGSLDYKGALRAGQRVQHMIAALYEVEKFHEIDGSLQTKQYLSETRTHLQEMLQILNVQESTLATISVVSDAAYAWGLIGAFTEQIHSRIRADPSTVLKLQSLFLKLRSIMDIPLLRISQSGSGDIFSVSEYYSSELVAYVRTVLEIIPVSIFSILNDISKQAHTLHDLPGRLEKESFRNFAQLDERYLLAKATQQIAVFSQGIMAMSKTFIGAIELDPRQLLEDGIRKQLVIELGTALHSICVFSTGRIDEFEEKLQEVLLYLQSQKKSMECFQDYVHVHGLQLWQEEYTRLINYNTEQECNQSLKRRVQDWQSTFQSKVIPIPRFPVHSKDQSKSTTFIGRIIFQLLHLTDPRRSMYLAPMSGWFDAGGQELIGIRAFTILQESLGPIGMMGIDCVLSFDTASSLQRSVAALHNQIDAPLTERMEFLEIALSPTSTVPDAGLSVYKEVELGGVTWENWIGTVAHTGQLQLLRCLIASQLHVAAKVEFSLVSYALDGMNKALISEMRSHTKNKVEEEEWIENAGGLVGRLSKEQQACGLHNPLKTVYITAKPPEHFALLVFLVTISQLPRYVLDDHLGTLTSRMKKATLDFCPLVAGLATLFQQFHFSHTVLYIEYLAQYVRAHFESIPVPLNDISRKGPDKQSEVKKIVTWIITLLHYLRIPFDTVESCLPPMIMDSIRS